MFTGIIETTAVIKQIVQSGSNVDYWITSAIAPELKVDQSIAHNGICLTVVELKDNTYRVTAVAETLLVTNAGKWLAGDTLNIERSLKIGDRLDGHFVQGHVDATALCIDKQTLDGSWLFTFSFDEQYAPLIIEKGAVCINGVSLTVFNVTGSTFTVTIIPYTYTHTNFNCIGKDSVVNVEFDVLGKYFLRHKELGGRA
ncbi:MAG: riboflavin synthase [Taibaiella sp.]|nr:riboflavin synthase [Taibaiella sp.]